MADLTSIAVPRPDDVVKQVTDPMLARTRRLRLIVTLGMLAPGLLTGTLFAVISLPPDSPVEMFFVITFWAGVLPAAAVYWYFSASMKITPKLVRAGVANIGRVVSFVDGSGKKFITVAWDADGKTHKAKLQATDMSTPMREGDAVTVLASADVKNQVGVVLGENGFYIADGK